MPELSRRVQTFTDSVIRRMTRISDEVDAINLSQGFPDFPPPKAITDRLREVADEGPHQYSVTFGAENFREALARKQGRAYGREINPDTEILVTCGGTEAMMSAMMTVCNPGDKVDLPNRDFRHGVGGHGRRALARLIDGFHHFFHIRQDSAQAPA